MDLKNILAVRPETLAQEQEKALADFTSGRLCEIAALISAGAYEQVKSYLAYSPAGDDMGCDNSYISFKDETGLEDIGEVIDRLIELEKKGTSK
jgi:hypothetical protein